MSLFVTAIWHLINGATKQKHRKKCIFLPKSQSTNEECFASKKDVFIKKCARFHLEIKGETCAFRKNKCHVCFARQLEQPLHELGIYFYLSCI